MNKLSININTEFLINTNSLLLSAWRLIVSDWLVETWAQVNSAAVDAVRWHTYTNTSITKDLTFVHTYRHIHIIKLMLECGLSAYNNFVCTIRVTYWSLQIQIIGLDKICGLFFCDFFPTIEGLHHTCKICSIDEENKAFASFMHIFIIKDLKGAVKQL